MGVYPRTCGGTRLLCSPPPPVTGLSPHVRGNLDAAREYGLSLGSIPARAGEPRTGSSSTPRSRVYPRTCGGTKAAGKLVTLTQGLSPHVRGNPRRLRPTGRYGGSIPARAGEPIRSRRTGTIRRVYPRTCGGTASSTLSTLGRSGLSPHVRGNLTQGCRVIRPAGSIPARAGEPWYGTRGRCRIPVYPRTCGGTPAVGTASNVPVGLSPHVRGNPPIAPSQQRDEGSIPARAGEPIAITAIAIAVWVYPRTCGGTAHSVDRP